MTSPMIDIRDLDVSFDTPKGPFIAVQNVSFQVARGEVFGIVGESGSGKTTLMRAMMGVLPAAKGSVVCAGTPVSRHAPLSFRRKVQMVMQDCYGSLNPAHTIDQIIGEPLSIHRFDRIEDRIVGALSDVGLAPTHRFRFPHQLSGGQRQRVAIARCLAIEPEIIFLDEPTSALDVSVQAEVVNLIMALKRARGLTLVMVSHDLPLVAHMCDRLVVMRQGRIVEELTSDALCEGRYHADYTKTLVGAALNAPREDGLNPAGAAGG